MHFVVGWINDMEIKLTNGYGVAQLIDGINEWKLVGSMFPTPEKAQEFIDFVTNPKPPWTPRKYQIVEVKVISPS